MRIHSSCVWDSNSKRWRCRISNWDNSVTRNHRQYRDWTKTRYCCRTVWEVTRRSSSRWKRAGLRSVRKISVCNNSHWYWSRKIAGAGWTWCARVGISPMWRWNNLLLWVKIVTGSWWHKRLSIVRYQWLNLLDKDTRYQTALVLTY